MKPSPPKTLMCFAWMFSPINSILRAFSESVLSSTYEYSVAYFPCRFLFIYLFIFYNYFQLAYYCTNDHRSYVLRKEKPHLFIKFRFQRDLIQKKKKTLRYRYSALSTELKGQLGAGYFVSL